MMVGVAMMCSDSAMSGFSRRSTIAISWSPTNRFLQSARRFASALGRASFLLSHTA